jgi:hypothetical protein
VENQNSLAIKVVNWVVERGVEGVNVNGVQVLDGAGTLARTYLEDSSYASHDDRIDALIRWEAARNFTTGFVTNLGGIITLPAALPASLGASWTLQARLAAAIAHIRGYDLLDERTKAFVVMTIVGGSVADILKTAGVAAGTKLTRQFITQTITGTMVREINRQVGFRLLTKAGEQGVVNLGKAVPFVGGGVAGVIDGLTAYAVGKTAKKVFGN